MLKPCKGGEEIEAFYFLGLVWSISMSGHRPIESSLSRLFGLSGLSGFFVSQTN